MSNPKRERGDLRSMCKPLDTSSKWGAVNSVESDTCEPIMKLTAHSGAFRNVLTFTLDSSPIRTTRSRFNDFALYPTVSYPEYAVQQDRL